jgi:hypothetical protein
VGPGTKLHELLESLGIRPAISCRCKEMMAQMDEWGVDGCRLHFTEIVNVMEEDAKRYKWADRVTAGGKVILEGLTFKVNPFNPIPSLVLEAIRRAEVDPPASAS